MSSGIGNARAQARSKLGDRSIETSCDKLSHSAVSYFTQIVQVSYITAGIAFYYHET